MADIRNIALGSTDMPVLDGYEPVKRLGYGAGSTIYLMRDCRTDESFAIKHVVRQTEHDKRMIDQVENEYHMARRVDHPYVRKVFDIHRKKRYFQVREVFMLMEFCPGISLEQSGGRSLLDLLLIFRMVANGLNGMHNAGLIHCDIKPNNIIISDEGLIRIIDLGQSCTVGTIKRRIQGTPDYIAPEQVKRKPLSRQTDVFNLGATMYWALTGRHIPTLIPKGIGKDRVDLAIQQAGPVPSPHEVKSQIPLGVSNLVMDCVRTQPAQRPADMPTVVSRLDLLIQMIAGDRMGNPTQNSMT